MLILIRAENDADQTGFGFLAHQFRGLPVVDIADRPHGRGAPGHAPALDPLAFKQMRHVLRPEAHRFQAVVDNGVVVTGMIRKHPVGDAPAIPVGLDPLADPGPIGAVVKACAVEVIGLAQLDAQTQITRVCATTIAGHREDLAALDHLAHGEAENPMEIRVPMIVATAGPAPPQIIDLSVQCRIGGRGAGADAGADDIVDQHLHRLRGDGVVAHQIAHAVAQRGPGRGDFRIRRRATGFPARRSAPP